MKIKYILFCAIIPVLALVLTGCSEYSDFSRGFYAGETVTPEQIAAISAGLAASESAASEGGMTDLKTEAENYTADTDAYGNVIVYWTAGGSVWHIDRNCSALSNSAAVESGTIKEAEMAGKSRACKKCGQNYSYSYVTGADGASTDAAT